MSDKGNGKQYQKLDKLYETIDQYSINTVGLMNSFSIALEEANAKQYPQLQPSIKHIRETLDRLEQQFETLAGYIAYIGIPENKLEQMSDKLHIPLDAMIDPEYRKEQTR